MGFARGKGVDASALERRDENGVEYVYAVKQTPRARCGRAFAGHPRGRDHGHPVAQGSALGLLLRAVQPPGSLAARAVRRRGRPLSSSRVSSRATKRAAIASSPGPHKVPDADSYVDVLRGAFVVPSEAEREERIREQVRQAEQKVGLVAELPAKIMEEVVNLAEYPTVMVGAFDELFLAVPKEITVDAMLVHQRYFPLFNADGSLANKFLITSNGDPSFESNIVDGNERVVAARLYDAKFFYDEGPQAPARGLRRAT